MRPISALLALGLLIAVPVVAANMDKAATPATGDAISLSPADLKWGDAPPDLPKGAKLSVLHGDPSKPAAFTVRMKMPAGYKVPPHWHSKDEQLTILSGTFIMHMGDSMTAPAHELGAGAYHFLPAKMHHAAETKGEVVLQMDGTGPFDIHYLNPADNPNKSASAK